jgi:putative acetyltransferase
MIHILAPLAVRPEFQRQGIGGLLIKAGIRLLQEKGTELIFVLGHKEYYPKYGFIPDAKHLGYPAPYPILDEHTDYWMVQPIGKKGFNIGKGKIICSDILNKPEHWTDDDANKL